MTERTSTSIVQLRLSAEAVRRAVRLSPYPDLTLPDDQQDLVVEVGDRGINPYLDDAHFALAALLEALNIGPRRVPGEATYGRRAHGLVTLLAITLGDGAEVLTPLPRRWTEEQMRCPARREDRRQVR